MKNCTRSSSVCSGLFAAGLFALSVSSAVAASPTTIDNTYGTIVIGDIPGMINRVSDFGKKISPMANADTLRGYLGMAIGDPGLKSMEPGNGVVLTIPSSGRPFMLLETAEGKGDDIVAAMKQRSGVVTAKINEKLMAIAMNEADLEKAKGAMGTAAAKLLDGNEDKNLLVTLDMDKLAQDKGAEFKAALKKLPANATAYSDVSSSGTARALVFAGNLIAAIAKRTDVATMKIDISGDGILIEKNIYPIGGVKLDPPQGPTGQELRKSLPANASALGDMEYYVDMQSALKGLEPIITEAATESGTSATDKDNIRKVFEVASSAYGDGMAGSWGVGEDGAEGAYLFSVANPAKVMEAIELETESMTTGSLSHLYSEMGLKTSATLDKNVKTVDGTPVHSFSMSMKPTNGKTNLSANMFNIRKSYVALPDNKLLMTVGDTPLESTLESVKAGANTEKGELESRKNLPSDGIFYADCHIGEMQIPGLASVVSDMFKSLKGTTIQEAAYADQESLKFMMMIPTEMVSKGVQGFIKMKQSMETSKNPSTTSSLSESTHPGDM